jgi:thioredoxin 1
MKHLKTLAEFNEAISSDTLVVIDFYAQWCGPCKAIAPYLVTLANSHPAVTFYKVDVDDAPEISQREKVRAMPTFGFYRGGEQLGVVIGANKNALLDQLTALSSSS